MSGTELFSANRATTTVTAGGTDAPAGGTSQTWTVASTSMFGAASTGTGQFHVADPAAPSEIIAVTNVSGTTWTVTRGAESTTPVAHAAGFTVYQIVTTGWLSTLGTAILPSGDTTGASDTAAVNAAIQAGRAAQLQNGTYYVTNLLPDSYGAIIGQGPGTILQAVSGTTGYMIALKTPASTQQVYLANFTLIPATGSLGGIKIDNTGLTAGIDPQHMLSGVLVYTAGGDSYHFGANTRGMRVTRCRSKQSGGTGFYLEVGCTDNQFTVCASSGSFSHGFYVNGWNNDFSACRTSLSGFYASAWGTTACGWEIIGKYNTFASCMAQQAALHGFDLNGAQYCTVSACSADTNNQGQTAGAGFNVNGATYCTVTGCVGQNNGGTGAGQVWGVQLSGALTGSYVTGNPAAGTSGGTTGQGAITVTTGQILCAPSQYAPGTPATLTANSTTMAAFSSANVNTGSFTAPPSGQVLVTATFTASVSNSSTDAAIGLAAHGTVTPLLGNAMLWRDGGTGVVRPCEGRFLVTGLTPGTAYNLDLLGCAASGNSVSIAATANTSTAFGSLTEGGPVIMTVQAA